jgi:nucleoside-diphosphate-sugar epimerase
MSEPATILVTGATGRLGTAVCRALLEKGKNVRATDFRFAKDFPVRVELGDLRDELFVYRVMEGIEAVVHLGNHPNQFAGPSPQRLLSENVAMNANVFLAAQQYGVRAIVFSSSVQAMVRRDEQARHQPASIAYLPMDAELPPNPGSNTYGLSKEFAERQLRLVAADDPALSVTAIRFPMLATEWLVRRFTSGRLPLDFLDFAECTAHLFLSDAGALVAEIVERRLPGYHQYFPAQTMDLHGYSVREMLRDRYAHVPLRKPLEEFTELADLIDISAISRELGWVPKERIVVEVER